jgi:O-antigen biosynthesis protein WbqP
MYQRVGKRILDIAISLCALLLLWPVLLLIALVIRFEDGGPALFRQKRVGKHGGTFDFLKFRSMPVNTANVPSHLAKQLRVTRVGRILRRTNLDELPQLFNILRGDMSLVGPRPALPQQEDVCSLRHQSGADQCLPGLTGLAQVNSFDGMTAEQKVAWDTRYARMLTLRTDLTILLRTFAYVLKPPPTY